VKRKEAPECIVHHCSPCSAPRSRSPRRRRPSPRNGVGTATLDGGDGDDDLRSEETADTLAGGAGDDKLSAGKGADVVHGGDGNDLLRDDDGVTPAGDLLDGGAGYDTLGGGPGRDQIAGDRQARCNELHCDFMDGFGNDTIDARDGEPDSVQCGPGTDTVHADPQDLVADDCEHVDRPGGAAPAAAKLTIVGSVHLRDVLRLKLTSRGRGMLKHRRRAVLTITAGKLRATVRLR
jgi:Ca2+-binding RTX toxin-like protein